MKLAPTEIRVDTQVLEGKIIVITGTLMAYTRDEAVLRITAAGGRVTSNVSTKTDFLIAGENAGSKLQKAQMLGVKVLTETDFERLLSN